MRRRIATGATALLLLTGAAAVGVTPAAVAAPGTCDPATRGEAYNQVVMQYPAPDFSGSVLVDVHYTWDGTSVKPDCDGPVTFLREQNTSDRTAWALLPNKKKAPLWVQINPGSDVTITAKGQLTNLGLVNYSDAAAAAVVFTQP